MDELDALKAISEKLEKLNDEERGRVLAWAIAKYGGVTGTLPQTPPPASGVLKSQTKAGASPRSTKKAKSIISMDKSVNLTPSGKKSASQFATEKNPANAKQKCVVAAYYLRDVLGLSTVSVSAVYTFFKTLGWVVPADLKNMLQQAGTQGWLDTAMAMTSSSPRWAKIS